LEQQYDEKRRETHRKVDDELLQRAYTIANYAVLQSQFNRAANLPYTLFGLLSASQTPFGHALVPVWIAESVRSPINFELRSFLGSEIQLSEDFLHRSDDNTSDYFQITAFRGQSWRSASLGDARLPLDPDLFSQMQRYDVKFEEFNFQPGKHVRMVMLKAPFSRTLFLFPPQQRPRGTGGRTESVGPTAPGTPVVQPPPVAPRPVERISTSPSMIIQVATDTIQRDQAVAQLDDELKSKLAGLEDEARESLFDLQVKLLWIGLAAFTAICVGGSLLIGLGLAPLRRLSDAVSRVSERDFRLQFEGPPPPVELEPIVTRLRQTLDALQGAFDREKQASADISHELRTPIAGLMTTLDVALRKPRTADEYRTTLQECREIVKQTSKLVERLLTLTWLDARSDKLRPETVDASELAEQCAKLIRPIANARGLRFELKKDCAVPITTDPDKLREVMANLMHNAIEYNRPDGHVSVRVQPTDGGLNFEVQDTGIGIAPENREKIFERFYRADPSRHDTGRHAGLGLAIVRGYVELLGGQISVESELGTGSTFRVRIPTLEHSNGTPRHHSA
jgi:signal transduction histidine kinase